MNNNFEKQNNALKLFKILANANRLKILRYLAAQKNQTAIVGQIALATNISESNLSNHLKLMRISKILSAKQSGANMFYSVKDPLVVDLLNRAFE